MNRYIIGDIETMYEYFLCKFYELDTKQWKTFEVNKNTNTLIDLVKYIEDNKEFFFVYYNGLRFDTQVIQYIINNYNNWINLSNLEICKIIANKAQDVIQRADNGKVEYPESRLSFKTIDVFEIPHYSNKNRMVALKRLQFEMDLDNIEEMPVNYKKLNLTDEELNITDEYCKNDVYSTEKFLQELLGNSKHPLYKDNNQIELRQSIMEEFKIPCLNYNMGKIGDELVKLAYCRESNTEYKDLPKKGTFRRKIAIKNCIPNFIKFKTPYLQEFLKKLKKEEIKANQEFHREVKIQGITHDLKKGGLHAQIENKIFESDENNQIISLDVASYYSLVILLCNKAPKHLNKEGFIKGFLTLYLKRVQLKPLAKKDNKIKGIVAGLKEANVVPFGKSGDMDSWLFDKEMMYSVTIGGECLILMLIEHLTMSNFQCFESNTDGANFIVPRNRIGEFRELCKEFSKSINIELNNLGYPKEAEFVLEESLFKKMVYSNINNYLAIYEDGSYKFKGDSFKSDFHYHENKSAKIVNLAVNQYFINKILPEDYIKNYNNIFDFCLRQKANRNFNYELRNPNSEEVIELKQLIRYFISEKGYKLMKIKSPECETNAAPVSNVHAPDDNNFQPLVTYCNKMPENKTEMLKEIDYYWYIDEAYKVIDKILKRKFKTRRPQLTQQLGFNF